MLLMLFMPMLWPLTTLTATSTSGITDVFTPTMIGGITIGKTVGSACVYIFIYICVFKKGSYSY